ncbi:hypothetical protein J3F83DRAFT_738858 [Trichoderma novae-zelandiae]
MLPYFHPFELLCLLLAVPVPARAEIVEMAKRASPFSTRQTDADPRRVSFPSLFARELIRDQHVVCRDGFRAGLTGMEIKREQAPPLTTEKRKRLAKCQSPPLGLYQSIRDSFFFASFR